MKTYKCTISVMSLLIAALMASPAIGAEHWISVGSSTADARENVSDGLVKTTSGKLDMVDHATDGNQYIGLLFSGLNVAQGATITNAYIQFTAAKTNSISPASYTIKAEAVDSAALFNSNLVANISGRATTASSATWTPNDWNTVDQAGTNQQTVSLTALVQEVVDRAGWVSGNSIAFVISGTGLRVFYAYDDGVPTKVAKLFAGTPPPPTYAITVSAGGNGSISPSGSVLVEEGSNITFTISANPNYHIVDVIVDTVPQGAITTYTITNVRETHEISASFAPDNTLTIPVTNSFEAYAPGYAITNLPGWTVLREVDVALVTNMVTGKTSPHFPGEADTKVLDVAGTFVTEITPDLSMPFVYVDMLVRPQCREKPPVVDNSIPPQIIAYVNNDEHLVVYHSYYTDAVGDYVKEWVTNTVDTIPSNQWSRLSFTIEFKGDPDWYDTYFQVRINDGAPMSVPNAYVGTSGNINPDGGTWMMTANLPIGAPGGWVSSVSVAGTCQIDDFVISHTNGADGPVGPTRTAHGTPYAWIDVKYPGTIDYEARDAEDSDSDGMSTWQEYWAGTDPTDPNSEFRIVLSTQNWSVAWLGGANADNFPYRVWRGTNLTAVPQSVAWYWSTDVARAVGTTNVWIDTEGTSGILPRAFYKITAPTNGW